MQDFRMSVVRDLILKNWSFAFLMKTAHQFLSNQVILENLNVMKELLTKEINSKVCVMSIVGMSEITT